VTSLILSPVTAGHVAEAQALVDAAPTFLMNVEGVPSFPGYAARDFEALPPGCTREHKHFFIIRDAANGAGVGLLDLVRDYPAPGTTFLGLLLLAEQRQRQGLGREAYRLAEALAVWALAARKLRLA
jgi:RimJ/RimL family protein N-acetyltransferase